MRLLTKSQVRDATNEVIRKNVARGVMMAKKVDESVAKLSQEKAKSEAALKQIVEFNVKESERLTNERLALSGEVARLKLERATALVPIEEQEKQARERMEIATAKLQDALKAKQEADDRARLLRGMEEKATRSMHEARVAQEESAEAAMLAQKYQLDAQDAQVELNERKDEFTKWFEAHQLSVTKQEEKVAVRERVIVEEEERIARLRKKLDTERQRLESRQQQLKLAYEALKNDQR